MYGKFVEQTYPSRKEFFCQYKYPIHPKYAIDVLDKKVKEMMKKRNGNPNDQTMLHV